MEHIENCNSVKQYDKVPRPNNIHDKMERIEDEVDYLLKLVEIIDSNIGKITAILQKQY